MFTPGAENFLRQAREIQDEELRKFSSRITSLLQNHDLGNDTIDCLQRLFLIVSATKYGRKLDGKFVELLQKVLCLPKCPEQIQALCAAILREMSPSNDLILSCDEIQDAKLLSLVSSILLAQGNKKAEVLAVGQRVVKVLEGRLPEGHSSRHLLPLLSKSISLSPASLTEDQTNLVNKRMVDWLRYASVQQGVAQPSGGFFSNPRARQPGPVTEVDGAVATDFFTVLSIGQYYTEDQWLNMQAFSMLRKWLLCYGSEGANSPNSDDKSEVDGSIMSMVSATSTSSRLLPPKERLREKAFEYCQRLIEQSNRRALKKPDGDLQKACLIEAVTIMDIICRQDSSYVYRTLSCLKILHGRISGDLAYARALLPIAQFFLNHSETAAVDSEAVYKHLFTRIPAQLFHSPMLAFEFIQFCRDNVQFFTENLSIFRRSFPNLFKLLAWNSPALISEFMDLLPALLGADTAIEIFHLLLDLPCLVAALDIQLRAASAPISERATWDPAAKPASCLEAFRHPLYRGTFQYLLRIETAPRDSPERLAPLRQLLGSMASCPRVVQCADTIPVLLQLYFGVVAEFADGPLINQLVLVLLERSEQLYEIPTFKADVHRVLSSQLVLLCKLYPSLVVELSKELLEFSGTVSNIRNKEDIFTYVVWAIGEYMSVSYDKRCTVEQINKFFEALEAMLFEITQLRPSASIPKYSPRVITVLMTTLTKLASRSQDLIPRMSLFLSKMRAFVQSPAMASVYSEEDNEEILTRAAELMNLLKMPSVAQFVLTPSAEVASPRFHRDTNVSLPLAMKTASRLLERGTGFVPG
ncbi:AP-5 complex subunit zeta-1 isoform X1 [Malaclemys terrapin pileata]|uniref:AP-5 complex subunit zeta-1 isoform X1 n=1 Tax=Malaclemys terrapin pileata TaxID=2991368 RepID=UPI0023A88EB6|nr:AP-5 complex subunit zeta-1 isoform X1 [Malaclemys terrapin pileata]